MNLTGITDEAGPDIHTQIQVASELGWSAIELRFAAIHDHPGASIHELPDEQFDQVACALENSGIAVPAIGSTIANWARSIDEPFDLTCRQLDRLVPRALRLGSRYVRIMSYAVRTLPDGSDHPDQCRDERIRRMIEIHRRLDEAGLVAVHENCMNYGGMGISHTMDLLAAVPGMMLAFDTGNPVFNRDRDNGDGTAMQDPWEFYQAVRPRIAHIHIKDCVWDASAGDARYTWPGEGDARVLDILADLHARGYDGLVSIEPHMAVVFHSTNTAAQTTEKELARRRYENFVAYARRTAELIATTNPLLP